MTLSPAAFSLVLLAVHRSTAGLRRAKAAIKQSATLKRQGSSLIPLRESFAEWVDFVLRSAVRFSHQKLADLSRRP